MEMSVYSSPIRFSFESNMFRKLSVTYDIRITHRKTAIGDNITEQNVFSFYVKKQKKADWQMYAILKPFNVNNK